MDQYKEHLAARVLQESRPITYKLLSRELKVHVHHAKQMLYDFHATENQKKPGSVHATYIITGTKCPEPATQANGHADEDVPMRSSPIPSSLPDAPAEDEERPPKVTLIKLVREEHMVEAKAQFEDITSIHVYSLEPGPLKDLQILSDCTREIAEKCSDEDPLHAWETYGSIHNPHSRRRKPGIKPQAPAPVATSAPAKTAPRPSTTAIPSKEVPAKGSGAQAATRSSTPQFDAAALPKKKVDRASLKKEASSIFASFAKAQPKKKIESKTPTPATKSAEQSQAEDEPMRDASEEEGEDDDDVVITGANQKSKEETTEAMKKARAEREAKEKKLRDMMDEDDDDATMQDAPAAASEEPEEPEKSDADAPAPAKPEPEPEKKDEVTVSNGRRRGRRRVMKKKTYKDDEGYFVTKEEPVWESFSEDEPQPKKPRPNPAATAKPKKGGGKQGQGSIMSFFAKKPS